MKAAAQLRKAAAYEATKKPKLALAAKLRAQAAELELDLNGPPVPGMQPTQTNYLVLLPSDKGQVERFDAAVKAMGAEPW
jgi:hypothetical protein